MAENKFYHIVDYPEFGLINLAWVRKIQPTYNEDHKDYKIFIGYGTKGGYSDSWSFGQNKLTRDAVLSCMYKELRNVYTDESELESAIEEIADKIKGVEADAAVEALEKKREFVDPTDLSQFPEVKV